VRLLLDEMYPAALADALSRLDIDALRCADLRLVGAPDAEIFAAAAAAERAVLTENVGDFPQLAADCLTSGGHHAGLLIALSSRSSRRPAGIEPLAAAVGSVVDEDLADRVVYLRPPR